MSGRDTLLARRARLVERAAAERDEIAGQLGAWRTKLAVVDRGLAIARGIRRSAPALTLGVGVGMAALAAMRPNNLGEWVRRGQAAWQFFKGRRKAAAQSGSGEALPSEGTSK